MLAGIGALVVGVAVTLLAPAVKSSAVFFARNAVSAVGFGSGLQGGIRTLVPRVAVHERAGVLSLLVTISYLGLGVPAVAAGIIAVRGPGLIGAAGALRRRADPAGRAGLAGAPWRGAERKEELMTLSVVGLSIDWRRCRRAGRILV